MQRGEVQQFTLTPRGDIDGLILTDGTEVKTPPHLSTEMAYSVKPGDTVTIHGLHAAALPLVQGVSITDEATGRTVIDNGPPGPGRGPGVGPPGPVPGFTDVQVCCHRKPSGLQLSCSRARIWSRQALCWPTRSAR